MHRDTRLAKIRKITPSNIDDLIYQCVEAEQTAYRSLQTYDFIYWWTKRKQTISSHSYKKFSKVDKTNPCVYQHTIVDAWLWHNHTLKNNRLVSDILSYHPQLNNSLLHMLVGESLEHMKKRKEYERYCVINVDTGETIRRRILNLQGELIIPLDDDEYSFISDMKWYDATLFEE